MFKKEPKVLKKCYIILVLIIFSCSKQEKEPYKLPENAVHLIAGDSLKVWKLAKRFNGKTRMNMGDCFLSYRTTYKTDKTYHDNNGDFSDCGKTLRASWEITADEKGNSYIKQISDQIPELMNIKENYKFFKILYLSKDSLTLQFSHKQFQKTRIITDYYVQEGVEVKDRDFHW